MRSLIAALVFLLACSPVRNPSHTADAASRRRTDYGAMQADLYTNAQGIIDDFASNEVRAENRYFGKRWRIDKFRVDTVTGRFIGMGAEPAELRMIFKDEEVEQRVETGVFLDASCHGHAYRGGHIVFKDCYLLDVREHEPAQRGAAEADEADAVQPKAPPSEAQPPQLPERAAGQGWLCIKSLDSEHVSTCFRTAEQCEIGRALVVDGGARYTRCTTQSRAACFTYFDILRSEKTFDCSATLGACKRQREHASTEMTDDVRDVSRCDGFD
jgi:hypothetical protein